MRKRTLAASSDGPCAANSKRRRGQLSASSAAALQENSKLKAPLAAFQSEEAPSPIVLLPDELLVKILRAVARKLPLIEGGRRWTAALREVHALRAVCKRFKEAIDAAGGPLALFEFVGWISVVERWLAGLEGGVDAFLAERAPRLNGLREVTVNANGKVNHGARFLAALPCWPSLVSLRLLSLPPGATGELRACLDALAAVPAAKLSLHYLRVNVGDMPQYCEEASTLLGAIVRRCAPSLHTLELTGIVLDGCWEDLLLVAGLRKLQISWLPRPVALGGLERSGAAATLETLYISSDVYDHFAGPGGPGSARALAALPALSSLTIDNDMYAFSAVSERPPLPPPPAGSFPPLRVLTLNGRFTRSDWWAAALASRSRAGAALREFSGPHTSLRSLSFARCPFGADDAPSLAGLLAACPALWCLSVRDCDEVTPAPAPHSRGFR
eukprot:tig00001065_g6728.t1